MAWEAIAGIINTTLEMINNHIKDPVKKMDAIKDFQDKALEKLKEVLNAEDTDKAQNLFVDFIHNL